MYTIWKLTISSILMFVRNKQALVFTLFTPLIIMGVFGLLSVDNPNKIQLGLAVTTPPNQATESFVNQLKDVQAFEVHLGAEPDERAALDEGDRSAVLIIPGDMFPEGNNFTPKEVTILTNANDPQTSGVAVSVVSQILDRTTLSVANAPTLFNVKTETINSRDLEYIDFLLPGIVALSVMQMSVFSVAFVFVDLKGKRVLKRLLATPMRPHQFVTANVITRLLVSVVQAAFLIAVGVFIFKAHVIGSLWLLLPSIILGAIMFLGLGFAVSGLAKTVESVPALANLIVFPMLFLGGTFFPIETMPEWLQNIANYLPLTYLSTALRDVMVEGASFADIQTNLLWMLGWSILLVIIANFTFSFEEKRQ